MAHYPTMEEIVSFEDLINKSPNIISLHNRDGIFQLVSPICFIRLGYHPFELIDQPLSNFCHPDDQAKVQKFFKENGSKEISYRIRRKVGDYIWFETNCITFTGEGMICLSRNISDQRIKEEELKEQIEKYRILIENSQNTLGIVTEAGYFIFINDAGKQLLGASRKEEIIGTAFTDFIHKDDQAAFRQYLINTFKDSQNGIEIKLVRTDNIQKYAEVILIPIVYKKRNTYQIILRDLTDKKETELMLQQSEKLSIVGQLAAGIAHEIRNPLTAIKGFAQLLKNNHDLDYIHVILTELDRVEKIVSDLLMLAKPNVPSFKEVDIAKLVDSVAVLLNTQAIIHNIHIKTDIQIDNPLLIAESDKLKQVFINIIKNAIEAMPNGGDIKIKICSEQPHTISIYVMDEGIGIPASQISKIGEPFYSTKEKGTGLGLMICNRIIKNHNGSMRIDSVPNKGTTIIIQLPQTMNLQIAKM